MDRSQLVDNVNAKHQEMYKELEPLYEFDMVGWKATTTEENLSEAQRQKEQVRDNTRWPRLTFQQSGATCCEYCGDTAPLPYDDSRGGASALCWRHGRC